MPEIITRVDRRRHCVSVGSTHRRYLASAHYPSPTRRNTAMIWTSAFAHLLLAVPLLAAGLAIGGPSAASAATACSEATPIAPGVTVRDSVVVPEGAVCYLEDGAVVRGGINILPGALVYILSGAMV